MHTCAQEEHLLEQALALPSLRAWLLFSNFSVNISKQETVITVYYTLVES